MDIKTVSILNKLEMIDEIENITEENLKEIESIEISGRDYNNDSQLVEFNDLKLFSNLKNLIISFCTIDDEAIDIISSFELNNLSFISCEFYDTTTSITNLNTNNIYISNCYNLDISLLENTEFNEINISTESINKEMNFISNKLNLEHSSIEDVNLLKNLNINELIISKTEYEQNPSLYDSFNYNVTIMNDDCEIKYNRMGDINV